MDHLARPAPARRWSRDMLRHPMMSTEFESIEQLAADTGITEYEIRDLLDPAPFIEPGNADEDGDR
jgi:hypothetical protein